MWIGQKTFYQFFHGRRPKVQWTRRGQVLKFDSLPPSSNLCKTARLLSHVGGGGPGASRGRGPWGAKTIMLMSFLGLPHQTEYLTNSPYMCKLVSQCCQGQKLAGTVVKELSSPLLSFPPLYSFQSEIVKVNPPPFPIAWPDYQLRPYTDRNFCSVQMSFLSSRVLNCFLLLSWGYKKKELIIRPVHAFLYWP